MTRRRRPVTTPTVTTAPEAPPPPPTAEELLSELRRRSARRRASLTIEADHLRAILARQRPGEAASNAWTAARLVAVESACEVWREVAEHVGEAVAAEKA